MTQLPSPLSLPLFRGVVVGMLTCALGGFAVVTATWLMLDAEVTQMVALGLPGAVALGAGLGALAVTPVRLLVLPAGVAAAFANALLTGCLLDLWWGQTGGHGLTSGLYMAAYGAVILSPVLIITGAVAGAVILLGTHLLAGRGA